MWEWQDEKIKQEMLKFSIKEKMTGLTNKTECTGKEVLV
jgi:hypothetical protein